LFGNGIVELVGLFVEIGGIYVRLVPIESVAALQVFLFLFDVYKLFVMVINCVLFGFDFDCDMLLLGFSL